MFTFKISDVRLENLFGLVFENVECSLIEFGYSQLGPLLITHWGVSGPSVLKLSAKGARELFEKKYDTTLRINSLPGMKKDEVRKKIEKEKDLHPSKFISKTPILGIPRRYWERILEIHFIDSSKKWSGLSSMDLHVINHRRTNRRKIWNFGKRRV